MADYNYGPSISDYRNGSLYQQFNKSTNLRLWNAYSSFASNTDPGINLTFLPDSVLELAFAEGNGNLSKALPVLFMLLNPNATQVDVMCSYPLSGAYDRLPRFLFYATLIIALLFRHNGIIGMAAISVVMTYSALAAIHLFVLLACYHWKSPNREWDKDSTKNWGDVDYMGILPVLTATAVMLAPLLTWSSTIRTNEARVVMVYWSFLIFSAMIPIIYLWTSCWELDLLPSFAYCTGTGTGCSWSELEFHMSQQTYINCDCVDFCGLLSPTAPLRTGTNMVANLGLKIAENAVYKAYNLIDETYQLVYVVWIFALAQGALSLLSIRSSPPQVRNGIFRILNADGATVVGFFFRGQRRKRMLQRLHIQDSDATTITNNIIYTKMRRLIAKLSATIYLTITITGMIIYPLALIATIVVNELIVDHYPISEQSGSVGAWSPLVAAGLVIIVSVLLKFHQTVFHKLCDVLHKPLRYVAYSKEDRPKEELTKRKRIKRTSNTFLDSFIALFDHTSFLIRHRKWHIYTQIKFFCEWWKDPENLSDPARWAHVLNADLGTKPEWTEVNKYRWDMEEQKAPVCRCRNCSFQHIGNRSDKTTASGRADSEAGTHLLEEEKEESNVEMDEIEMEMGMGNAFSNTP